jgi:hypothetical protein
MGRFRLAGWALALAFAVLTPSLASADISSGGTLDGAAPTQTGRLSRTGVPSACGAAKVNPGLTTATGTRSYLPFTVTNSTATTRCYIVTMTAADGINLYAAAYLGSFDPSNPATNFLADAGASQAVQTFGFDLAGGQTAIVVVHDVNVNPPSGDTFTLTAISSEIPTLGDWAMIGFVVMLAGGALFVLYRRRVRAA